MHGLRFKIKVSGVVRIPFPCRRTDSELVFSNNSTQHYLTIDKHDPNNFSFVNDLVVAYA